MSTTQISTVAYFLLEKLQVRKQWSNIFEVQKEKKKQIFSYQIVYQMKIVFRNRGELDHFQTCKK